MVIIKGIVIAVLVLIVLFVVLVIVGIMFSAHLSIPYDEWVENDRQKRGKKHGKNNSR